MGKNLAHWDCKCSLEGHVCGLPNKAGAKLGDIAKTWMQFVADPDLLETPVSYQDAMADLEELQEELRQEQVRNKNNVGMADLESAELLGALQTIAGGILPDGDHVNLPTMVFAEDILKTHGGE